MVTHKLKTWPNYWDAVKRGEKTFEVRRDDRGFQKGDVVVLEKYSPDEGYAWRDRRGHALTVTREISYILTGGQLGIEPGYVVLGLCEPSAPAAEEAARCPPSPRSSKQPLRSSQAGSPWPWPALPGQALVPLLAQRRLHSRGRRREVRHEAADRLAVPLFHGGNPSDLSADHRDGDRRA